MCASKKHNEAGVVSKNRDETVKPSSKSHRLPALLSQGDIEANERQRRWQFKIVKRLKKGLGMGLLVRRHRSVTFDTLTT